MKTTRSLFVSVFVLVVLAAAAFPAYRFLSASANTIAAPAAASQQLTALDRYGHNLTGEFIPGQLKTSAGFVGSTVPYQAEAWLKQDAQARTSRQSMGSLDRFGHNLTGEAIQGRLKTLPGFVGDKVPYQADAWLKQDAQARTSRQSMGSLDRFGHNLTGDVIPGQLKASAGFVGDKVPYQAKPWIEQETPAEADDSSSLKLTGAMVSLMLIGPAEPFDNIVLPVEPRVTF